MIKHYITTDKNGYVISSFSTESEKHAEWVEIDQSEKPSFGVERLRLINGKIVPTGEPLVPVTVSSIRSVQYPTVGDQLGAIWKAIAPLIEHPEAEAILAQIQAVKDANPKPSN